MDTIIFKTSVNGKKDLSVIAPVFNLMFGEKKWLFAFEDKLLKVFTSIPCVDVVRYILKENGFFCEEVNDYLLV